MPCKWYNLGYCEWNENRCDDTSNIECENHEEGKS